MDDRAIGRGAFLGLVGTGVLGLFFARDLTSAARRVLPSQVDGFVPGSNWRISTVAASMPKIAADDLRVTVDGLVDRPGTFTLADLQQVGSTAQVSDFHCVTGWTVEDVRWVGVTLRDLLGHVGAQPGAKAVRFISAEKPYEDSLTRDQAMLGDVMLAWQMDGAPLAREHGGPLRLVMPAMYGYKSVKWVTHIRLESTPQPGFWERNGYDADAWVGRSNGA